MMKLPPSSYRVRHQWGNLYELVDEVTGRVLMTEESFTICDRLADALNGAPYERTSELGEVAYSVRVAACYPLVEAAG